MHWGSVLTLLPAGIGMKVAYIDASHRTPFWTLLVADDMDVKAAGVHFRRALFVFRVFSTVLRVPFFWTKTMMNTVGTFGVLSAYYWGLGEKVSGRMLLEAIVDQVVEGELYLDRLTDLVSRAKGGSESRASLRPRSRHCLKLSPCLMAILLPFLLLNAMTTGIRPSSGASASVTCVPGGRAHWSATNCHGNADYTVFTGATTFLSLVMSVRRSSRLTRLLPTSTFSFARMPCP